MRASEAADLVRLFDQHNLEVYVDGGWAVDALLGEQTRSHADLDIAIPHAQVAKLRELLGARGYQEHPSPGSWECNFVLADADGRKVDVHSYTLDDAGNPIFGVPYPGQSLTGTGVIDGHPVKCISPEWLVKFHSGYELDDNDRQDVRLLCERFGIPLPEEFIET